MVATKKSPRKKNRKRSKAAQPSTTPIARKRKPKVSSPSLTDLASVSSPGGKEKGASKRKGGTAIKSRHHLLQGEGLGQRDEEAGAARPRKRLRKKSAAAAPAPVTATPTATTAAAGVPPASASTTAARSAEAQSTSTLPAGSVVAGGVEESVIDIDGSIKSSGSGSDSGSSSSGDEEDSESECEDDETGSGSQVSGSVDSSGGDMSSRGNAAAPSSVPAAAVFANVVVSSSEPHESALSTPSASGVGTGATTTTASSGAASGSSTAPVRAKKGSGRLSFMNKWASAPWAVGENPLVASRLMAVRRCSSLPLSWSSSPFFLLDVLCCTFRPPPTSCLLLPVSRSPPSDMCPTIVAANANNCRKSCGRLWIC